MFTDKLKQKLQKQHNQMNCNKHRISTLSLTQQKDSIFLSKKITSFSNNRNNLNNLTNVNPKLIYNNFVNSTPNTNANANIQNIVVQQQPTKEKIELQKIKKLLVDLVKSGYIVTGGLNTNLIESSLFNLTIKGNLLPSKTNFYSLGNNIKQWKNLFLQNSIYLNGQEIKYDLSNNRFEFEGDVKITDKLILSSDNKEIYYNTTDNKFIIDGNVKINGTLESDSGGGGGCGGMKFLDDILYVNTLYVVNELIATKVKHKDISGTDLSDKKILNLFLRNTSGTPDFVYPCENTDILLIGNDTLIAATSFILQINGDAYFSNTVRALKFKALSDKRLKTNIQTLLHPIEILNKIRGVSFAWKSNLKASCGIIAQEVEKAIPEAVDDNNNNDYKTVDYSCLIGYLIEGVKENNKIIRKQNKRIEMLEKNNEDLQNKLNLVNEKINKIEKLLNIKLS